VHLVFPFLIRTHCSGQVDPGESSNHRHIFRHCERSEAIHVVRTFVCANRTRDRGCSKHPVFPAPSNKEGGKLPSKPRTQCAARTRSHICVGWVERSDTHRPRIPALMGIASLCPSYEIACFGR